MYVSLDFETRSFIDIKYGAHRYAEDRTTEPLCLAWQVEDEGVNLWVPPAPPPQALLELARDPRVSFRAFNATFERCIWNEIMATRYSWPRIPLERWYCTQADAYSCALPGRLVNCADALRLPINKDPKGTYLINKLCKPYKGKFRDKREFHSDFLDLYRYCKQDVLVEHAVFLALPYIASEDPLEREIYLMVERMNDRGVPVDTVLMDSIVERLEKAIAQRDEEVARLTGGRLNSARQRDMFLKMLDTKLPNLQKATVARYLKKNNLPATDRRLLELRQEVSHTAVSKFKFMADALCRDNTLKDNLQYNGAATGRLAGRGVQIQNLPRECAADPDGMAADITNSEFSTQFLEFWYDKPFPELASLMIRPTFCAPEGKTLVCYDFSQIESRDRAWAVKDTQALEAFAKGLDIYIDTAARMFNQPYDSITKEDPLRQAGKVSDLACGFQGGWKALISMAEDHGLTYERKEAGRMVRAFRAAKPMLVRAWNNFELTAMKAIRTGDAYTVPDVEHCIFEMQGEHLSLELPSGRKLWFPFARIESVLFKYEDEDGVEHEFEKDAITHEWVDNYTNRWTRRSISGGSLFQSYVQATCRDLLMYGQLRLEKDGWPLVLSVHDEVGALVPDTGEWREERFEDLLCRVPSWADGLPIKAGGWTGRRYRK